ncbi:hypothetical protein RB195_019181 [Necator americanus]|uniref:Uncharacterized protein n=1 Tax=Necator americanus TaxID=51031 RepID=A0ABR1CE12_NECAM
MRFIAQNTLDKTTLGKPNIQKATWFWNKDVQAAIPEKKSKYKLWWRTRQPEDRGAYLAVKRGLRRQSPRRSRTATNLCTTCLIPEKASRQYIVRSRHLSTLDMEHTKIAKGADGAVLRRSGQILERWREYYNHLCNEEFCHPPISTVPSVVGPVLPINAEVSTAFAKTSKSVLPSQKRRSQYCLRKNEVEQGNRS